MTKEDILELLENNDRAVEKAILAIYARQTEDEQRDKETKEHNNIGFNGTDAKLLSDFALQLQGKKPWCQGKPKSLSEKQMVYARRKIKKYWHQLLEIAEEKEAQNTEVA